MLKKRHFVAENLLYQIARLWDERWGCNLLFTAIPMSNIVVIVTDTSLLLSLTGQFIIWWPHAYLCIHLKWDFIITQIPQKVSKFMLWAHRKIINSFLIHSMKYIGWDQDNTCQNMSKAYKKNNIFLSIIENANNILNRRPD